MMKLAEKLLRSRRRRGLAMMPATLPAAVEQKPNMVFLLLDNRWLGAFGVYGGTVPTPQIDKLASEGIRFNNY